MTSTMSAYMEKMKEMSMLSLLCSCFSTQIHGNRLHQYGDLEVKALNKRLSGQSFEVVLKNGPPGRSQPQTLPSPPRREVSLEELQKKMDAADERRKSHEALVLKQLAEKGERVQEVLHKAREENDVFSKKTEEKLLQKMEASKENREAQLKARKLQLRDKKVHAAQVRRNRRSQVHLSG